MGERDLQNVCQLGEVPQLPPGIPGKPTGRIAQWWKGSRGSSYILGYNCATQMVLACQNLKGDQCAMPQSRIRKLSVDQKIRKGEDKVRTKENAAE